MESMTTPQVTWLAGLFEGEGTVFASDSQHAHLQIKMTDEDVVRRAHKFTGVGHVTVHQPKHLPKYKERPKCTYVWRVTRRDDVRDLLKAMLPYLGHRRTEQAMSTISWIEARGSLRPGVKRKAVI